MLIASLTKPFSGQSFRFGFDFWGIGDYTWRDGELDLILHVHGKWNIDIGGVICYAIVAVRSKFVTVGFSTVIIGCKLWLQMFR